MGSIFSLSSNQGKLKAVERVLIGVGEDGSSFKLDWWDSTKGAVHSSTMFDLV